MASKKILLIDDDKMFNDTVKEMMEVAGYEVVPAYDGLQGEKLFHQVKPDLVITDIFMPEEDGIGFLIGIGEDDLSFPCKVIAISGGGRAGAGDYLDMAKSMGVDDILEKPFTMNALLQKIEQQIP